MYQTCIFDLYGTLVDIHTEEDQAELWEKLAMFYGYYGAVYEGSELQKAYLRIVRTLQKGEEQLRRDSHESFPEIQIEQVFAELFREKGVHAEGKLPVYAGQFFRILSTEYLRLYEGTKEMLERLRRAGKRIYLLSNAQRIFTEYEMKLLGIDGYFDGIFISSDYPYRKPDVRFFYDLLETYGIVRDTAVMIGNDGICDIEGAKRAGLHTLYVRTDISPKEPLPEADEVLEKMHMRRIGDILLGKEGK